MILAQHPDGVTEQDLASALYGTPIKSVTIRAEISRLHKLLGPVIRTRPYRIAPTCGRTSPSSRRCSTAATTSGSRRWTAATCCRPRGARHRRPARAPGDERRAPARGPRPGLGGVVERHGAHDGARRPRRPRPARRRRARGVEDREAITAPSVGLAHALVSVADGPPGRGDRRAARRDRVAVEHERPSRRGGCAATAASASPPTTPARRVDDGVQRHVAGAGPAAHELRAEQREPGLDAQRLDRREPVRARAGLDEARPQALAAGGRAEQLVAQLPRVADPREPARDAGDVHRLGGDAEVLEARDRRAELRQQLARARALDLQLRELARGGDAGHVGGEVLAVGRQ